MKFINFCGPVNGQNIWRGSRIQGWLLGKRLQVLKNDYKTIVGVVALLANQIRQTMYRNSFV